MAAPDTDETNTSSPARPGHHRIPLDADHEVPLIDRLVDQRPTLHRGQLPIAGKTGRRHDVEDWHGAGCQAGRRRERCLAGLQEFRRAARTQDVVNFHAGS